jgi:hypothetical protein
MKVCLKGMKNFPVEGGKELVRSFSEFLQSQSPLINDITIEFLDTRQGKMTTGVRYPGNKIQVLSSGRLPIDVLRTLSHEWIHEFQTQKLGVDDSKPIQDIGGPEENMCNVLSGIFIKQFEQTHPEFDDILYGGN